MAVIDFSTCMLGFSVMKYINFYGEFMKYIDGGFLVEGVRVYIIAPLVFPLFASCVAMNQISCPRVLVICSHASLPFYLLPLLNMLPWNH